jgi:hypothetical protein
MSVAPSGQVVEPFAIIIVCFHCTTWKIVHASNLGEMAVTAALMYTTAWTTISHHTELF